MQSLGRAGEEVQLDGYRRRPGEKRPYRSTLQQPVGIVDPSGGHDRAGRDRCQPEPERSDLHAVPNRPSDLNTRAEIMAAAGIPIAPGMLKIECRWCIG